MTHRGLAWRNMHGAAPSLSVQIVVNYIAHDSIGMATKIQRITLFGKCETHAHLSKQSRRCVTVNKSLCFDKHNHEHCARIDA